MLVYISNISTFRVLYKQYYQIFYILVITVIKYSLVYYLFPCVMVFNAPPSTIFQLYRGGKFFHM
jgi:hypothetical protein